jgi:hypothetical protein
VLRSWGAAAGGAILLGVVKNLSRTLPSLVDFIRGPKANSLVQPVGLVYVAAFGLALTAHSLADAPGAKPPVIVSVLPHAALQGGRPIATFYVMFEENVTHGREFTDRGPGEGYDRRMGLLNRRAEIYIQSAAGCELRTPALRLAF